MCCLPPGFESSRGRDESVFQTIPWSDLVDAIEDGDLVAAATTTLRHKLRGLQENMRSGKIVVDICPPCLVSQDSARDVARWNASTISWSNVMDYMRVETFHALARRSGTPSTVHSGYSMGDVDQWTATFASGNLKFIHHELLSFSVLARGNSTLHLSWHYD
ncbi:hypothetical protein LEN26_009028 [Aphanomyces euteiches]|nr:hypothetical protein LEN26_009028 [Aphanomyces euteiches]